MQLAPLRPRRRRSSFDSAGLRENVATTRPADLSAVAARIAGLIDGPVTEALVVMLTELYGDALARVLAAIEMAPDGAAILARMCEDKLVGGLLVVHDLHPQTLDARVQGALDAATTSVSPPLAVVLDRIEEDVVYLRFGAAIGTTERSAIAYAIASAAPEITRVCSEHAIAEEFFVHA